MARAFLLALEETLGGYCYVLACPGGKWSVRPCLPWRRVVRAFFQFTWETKPAIVWTHSLNFDWLLTDFCS